MSGIVCPSCESPLNKVVDSRPTLNGESIIRRRHCSKCQHRFSTWETRVSPGSFDDQIERVTKALRGVRRLVDDAIGVASGDAGGAE